MIEIQQKDLKIILWSIVGVFGILGLFLATKIATEIYTWQTQEIYPARTLMVSAEGEALAVADIATFSFSVDEEGVTSEEAQKKATEKINNALSYFKSAGVEEKDIKTQNYSIYPKYEMIAPCYAFDCPVGNPEIVGYTVSQTIQIKVRDIDNTGKFVTELTKFGINSISGITFTIDDEEILYAQARAQAIEKAEQKIQELAKDLNVKVGKVVSFNEENPQTYYGDYGYGEPMMMKEGAYIPQIPQGENTYTTRVYVTYELK
jgi:uncharacterized protein